MEAFNNIKDSNCSFNFVSNVFNMVKTTDSKKGLIVLGQFIQSALDRGEKVAFVSFSNPAQTLEVFRSLGFFFEDALIDERLIYLYYKTNFAKDMSLTQDFKGIFEEIETLGCGDVTNIAFENADVLLNTQSSFLTMSSVQMLASITGNHKATFLGQYVEMNNEASESVDQACQKILASYYSLEEKNNSSYVFDHSKRSKGLARSTSVRLGKGFVRE